LIEIGGDVTPRFEPVRRAFTANFEERGEVGASLAVYVGGERVVDLWGGVVDQSTGRPYTSDTLQLVMSTTKGVTAVCALLLMERGELDVDAPVARYWPEFAQNDKESIPVRMLLNHQAGLYTVDAPPSYEETLRWDPIVDALAAQRPLWEPGTKHGYHAITYGWLVGEVVRRVSGRSIGAYLRDEIVSPLDIDLTIGTPTELHSRVTPLIEASAPVSPMPTPDPGSPMALAGRAMAVSGALQPPDGSNAFNRPDLWEAEVPAVNAITNGRSIARLYASLVGEIDGIRTLQPETIAAATVVQDTYPDEVMMGMPSRFGLGFKLSSDDAPLGGPRGFGHAGAGGSVGFADPDAALGFGYVMNQMQMQTGGGDARALALAEAVYASL